MKPLAWTVAAALLLWWTMRREREEPAVRTADSATTRIWSDRTTPLQD